MRIFKTALEVRGYELDGYGHVNHSVYLQYAEYARAKMIEEAIGGFSAFTSRGVAPVVARAEVDYKVPCYLAERLEVWTTVKEFRRRVVVFAQEVRKPGADASSPNIVAARVQVPVVVVGKDGKTVDFPAKWEQPFGNPI